MLLNLTPGHNEWEGRQTGGANTSKVPTVHQVLG